ncbi:hypothetical protein C8J56DRAFT_1050721 [Mycena floridula]|nr:hypothetical protein C8J56DRAFT_1050721 [Mycena floridula]
MIRKGDGLRTVVVANQVKHPEAQAHTERYLQVLQELTMLMMPCSISKHQWEMTTFHLEDNNSFSFGGLQPGPIALQINISSILNAKGFFEALGAIQSRIHGDDGDDTTMATNFHLIYRLPPFSDPGTFILCRMGSYVEETDSWYLLIVFGGQDQHSPQMPCALSKLDPDWWLHDKTLVAINTEWCNAQFITHIGNVIYVPVQASQQNSRIAVSTQTIFGPEGTTKASDLKGQNYVDDRIHALGELIPHSERISREAVLAFMDTIHSINGTLPGITANNLLQMIEFKDPQSREVYSLHPMTYDSTWN